MRFPGASLTVPFRVDDSTIHHVRLMVHSFALLLSKDRALAGRLTVACAELVQVFPDTEGGGALRIEVDESQRTTVTVSAELTSQAEAKIVAATREVNRGSPLDAYTRALSSPSATATESLPLARVRYEAQMDLSFKRAGPQATIVATATR